MGFSRGTRFFLGFVWLTPACVAWVTLVVGVASDISVSLVSTCVVLLGTVLVDRTSGMVRLVDADCWLVGVECCVD